MRRFLSSLFGCRHVSCSWPIGPTEGPQRVVCVDCGAEFEYSFWGDMKRGQKWSGPPVTKPAGQGVTTADTDTPSVAQPSSEYPDWIERELRNG